MTETVTARLLGGPFDGDEGGVIVPLPEALWVHACPGCRRGKCAFGGIHWTRTGRVPDAVVYQRGPVDDGVQIYVHRDLELQSLDKRSRYAPAPPEEVAHAA